METREPTAAIGRNEPGISVVIPCFNSERLVRRCIESVIDQAASVIEVIVVDDGSTDSSLEVIKEFSSLVTWKTGPNQGACAARNLGLSLVRSEHVIFLDSDDFLNTHALSGVAPFLTEPADLYFCGYNVSDEGGDLRSISAADLDPKTLDDLVRTLILDAFFPPVSLIWRTDFVRQIGGWGTSLRHQDAELVYRALAALPTFRTLDVQLGTYYQHSGPRISGKMSSATLHSCIDVFESTNTRMNAVPNLRSWREYGSLWAYSVMTMAARSGDRGAYERAYSLWKAAGGKSRERRSSFLLAELVLKPFWFHRLKRTVSKIL